MLLIQIHPGFWNLSWPGQADKVTHILWKFSISLSFVSTFGAIMCVCHLVTAFRFFNSGMSSVFYITDILVRIDKMTHQKAFPIWLYLWLYWYPICVMFYQIYSSKPVGKVAGKATFVYISIPTLWPSLLHTCVQTDRDPILLLGISTRIVVSYL